MAAGFDRGGAKASVEYGRTSARTLKTQAGVDQKLSEDDFDPVVMQLSDKITEARAVAKQAADTAGEGWAKIQKNAISSLEDLNEELARAAENLDNK